MYGLANSPIRDWEAERLGSNKVFEDIKKAVLSYDADATLKATKLAIKSKINPMDIIEKGLVPAIDKVGDKFEKMEIFLPDLMMAADAVKSSVAILLPLLPKEGKGIRATVVAATVQGDVHEIGKNIVASMLMARGFNVIDMGVDVKSSLLVEQALKSKARIIAASALMSSTIGSQKDIIDYLSSIGDRRKVAVLIGGGPTSKKWADEIGADGWGKDASEAVRLAEKYSKGK
jgi:corrinoid protein of di/trimethylamine methyltransferase